MIAKTHEQHLLWNYLISDIPQFDIEAAKAAGCDIPEIVKAAGDFLQQFAKEADSFKDSSAAQKQYARLMKRAEEVVAKAAQGLTPEQKKDQLQKAADDVLSRPGVRFDGNRPSGKAVDTSEFGFKVTKQKFDH